MILILTRHGETEENKAGILMGHLPGKLSANGIKQAKKVALRLKKEKINYIYSSDLARSSDTAKEIAKFHTSTPIKFIKDLRERNLGELQGKHKNDADWDAKGGETLMDLCKRAEKFLKKILKKHENDTILFVAHDVVNKAFITVITGKNFDDIKKMPDQKNTSLSIFKIDKNGDYKIIISNDIKHLK